MKLNSTDAIVAIQQPNIIGTKINDGTQYKSTSQGSDQERVPVHVSEKKVSEAVQKVNKVLDGFGHTTLEYSIHEKTHDIIVKVLNKDTKEVIREIPSEKILDMVAYLMEMSGILVDERR